MSGTDIHKKPKNKTHKPQQKRENKYVEFYSWMIGFIEGLTLGITYGICHKNSESIDIKKVDEGFSYGFTESIWCCGLL